MNKKVISAFLIPSVLGWALTADAVVFSYGRARRQGSAAIGDSAFGASMQAPENPESLQGATSGNAQDEEVSILSIKAKPQPVSPPPVHPPPKPQPKPKPTPKATPAPPTPTPTPPVTKPS